MIDCLSIHQRVMGLQRVKITKIGRYWIISKK